MNRRPVAVRGALWAMAVLMLASGLCTSISALEKVDSETCSAVAADGSCVDDTSDELGKSEAENRGVDVFFVNDANIAASVYWDDGDTMSQVVASIPSKGRTRIGSFTGHTFLFTREGNRDPLSELVTIKAGETEYHLTQEMVDEANARGANSKCADRSPRKCAADAARGECDANPGWMIVNCPSSCNSCHLLDPRKRCSHSALNVTTEHVWKPGDLDALFLDILENQKDFEPRAVSRPPEGPWVIVFDKFMNEQEAEVLIDQGHRMGFARSTDTGTLNERGEVTKIVSQTRTSSNSWCIQQCERNATVQELTLRIENITKIPRVNFEQFQLLQYFPGQFYRVHHDMGDVRREIVGGHRILTFFVYISDVEEGGETAFPKIKNPETGEMGLSVKPRRGRAVLWPSVLDSDPWKRDERTFHSAEPVVSGVKYAANQ